MTTADRGRVWHPSSNILWRYVSFQHGTRRTQFHKKIKDKPQKRGSIPHSSPKTNMEPENDGSQEGISSSSCSLSGSMLACRCVYRLKTYLTTFDIYIIKWPENMLPFFKFWRWWNSPTFSAGWHQSFFRQIFVFQNWTKKITQKRSLAQGLLVPLVDSKKKQGKQITT